MDFYLLPVQYVKQLTSRSIRIDLSVPDNLKNIFIWKPGQFLRFRFEIDGEFLEREYSICTAPYEGIISIAVKVVSKPRVSEYVQKNIKAGDHLQVSAPLGVFGIPSRPNEKRTLVAFSAGSGITPVMSILKDTLQKEKGVNFYLFYGNATEQEVMFKSELEDIKNKYPDNFHLYYFYSDQEVKDRFFQGMIDSHKLDLIINQIMDWDEVDEVLICGPKPMIITLANAVYHHGIPKKNIHYELYESAEKIYEDDEIQKSSVKEVEVTYIFEGNSYKLTWINNGNTLLDALLESGVKAPYSCKGGVCGACSCTKEKGEVILGENLVLTDEDLENQKILTCVAYPRSEKLTINLDQP